MNIEQESISAARKSWFRFTEDLLKVVRHQADPEELSFVIGLNGKTYRLAYTPRGSLVLTAIDKAKVSH